MLFEMLFEARPKLFDYYSVMSNDSNASGKMMIRLTASLKVLATAFFTLLFIVEGSNAAPQSVDTIVYGDYVVTMSDDKPYINDGAVAITGTVITAVGTRKEIDQRYSAKQAISGEGRIVMPGLINGHTHTSMTLFRGMADDLKLMNWLNNYIFPMEGRFVNSGFIKAGSELACWEMIRGGTTTFVDMYFYPDTIADVVERCGLRAIIASPSIDFPSPGFKGWDDSFQAAVDFVVRWKGKHERITPAFAPHAPYTVSPEHLSQVAKKANELQVPVSIHIAEAPSELTIIKQRYQTTPVKHVAEQGLMNNRLIAAHMVHPSPEEIQMMAAKPVGAIHNPTSNLKLAAGIAPVPTMLAAGVSVGLGTDGAASNNDLDLWEEMRLSALIHKQQSGDPTVVPAMVALEMATSMGAEAIGLGDVTGRLKAGMRADIIQVSLDSPRLAPLYNVISHLVYMVDSNDVVTSMVSGVLLMNDGKVLSLNGAQVKAAAEAISLDIAKALNESPSAAR